MCSVCFATLKAALTKGPAPQFKSEVEAPLFVTWKKQGDLRGCIGTFSPSNLSKLLPQYALISALKDSRFPPVKLAELPQLSVAVSILVNFQKGKGALDWEVGKHGIIIEFESQGEQFNATFLPEVAPEQGWDREETLRHLVRKAGYRGSVEKILKEIRLTTYESSKAELQFREWEQEQAN